MEYKPTGKAKDLIKGIESSSIKKLEINKLVRLYINIQGYWEFTFVCGYAYSYLHDDIAYISIAQVENGKADLLFKYECYEGFEMKQENDFFLTFEDTGCMYGILFIDKGDAKDFFKDVKKIIPKKKKEEIEISSPTGFQSTLGFSSSNNQLSNIHPDVLQVLEYNGVTSEDVLKDPALTKCLFENVPKYSASENYPTELLQEICDHVLRIAKEKERMRVSYQQQNMYTPQKPPYYQY